MPGFVNYKKGCTRPAAASDKVYHLLARGQWFSQGTLASSTTKTGHHDIAEILLKVALKTKNQSNHKYIKMEVRIRCEQAIYNIHDYVEGTSVLIGYSPNYIL